MLERARQAPTLFESLEILFTAHCCEESPRVISAFVVDLYAEASRNPQIADMVRDVFNTAMDGVTDLIARAPEAQTCAHGLPPAELAELIFAVARGMLMLDVLQPPEMTRDGTADAADRSDPQTVAALFKNERTNQYMHDVAKPVAPSKENENDRGPLVLAIGGLIWRRDFCLGSKRLQIAKMM